jgi:ATP-dependent RNA helicase RhlE
LTGDVLQRDASAAIWMGRGGEVGRLSPEHRIYRTFAEDVAVIQGGHCPTGPQSASFQVSHATDPTLSTSPSFASLALHPNLQRGLKELGFARPTPIQADAIPPALEGRDLLACAMTGSGKTYAFLLPILHQLMEKPRGVTRALVLTPTRELAAQILESQKDVAIHTPLTAAAVFGGVGMGPQEHAFRSGVDILIATPGRLLDHFRQPYAKLDQLEFLVLDEADRMLDMGFLPEIKKILRHLPSRNARRCFQRDDAGADCPVVA